VIRTALKWGAALVFALLCGVAMSYGQTYAPDALAPFFNSAAPVVVVAGVASLAAKRWWGATVLGAAAAPLLVAGYYLTSHLRGFANNSSWIALWATAGIIVGATMGLAWWLLRSRVPAVLRAAGAAALPGILVGEAWHGLARISDTTPAAYWWTQAAIGVAVLVVAAARRVPTWPARLLAVGFAGAVALAVYTAYGVA
jgi:hypothetical protein